MADPSIFFHHFFSSPIVYNKSPIENRTIRLRYITLRRFIVYTMLCRARTQRVYKEDEGFFFPICPICLIDVNFAKYRERRPFGKLQYNWNDHMHIICLSLPTKISLQSAASPVLLLSHINRYQIVLEGLGV